MTAARRSYRRLRPALEHYSRTHGTPDVIHAHNLVTGGLLARHVHEDFGIPYVVTEHTSTFAGDLQSVKQAASTISDAAEAAQRIIAVGHQLAAHLRSGLPPEVARRVTVVPNVVDPVLLREPITQHVGPFSVSALGELTPRKNYGLLIEAFADADLPRDARLVIGGSGPEEAGLCSLAERLQVQDRVRFPGQLDRPEVIRLLRESSVFAHPSNSESFGVVLIEALACGVPVVATASGGPSDIITPEVGHLVPCHDVGQFARALEHVHENRAAYDRDNLREICRERFGPETFAARMLAIYRESVS